MALPAQTSSNNASAAEMKFWREWADKAPDLIQPSLDSMRNHPMSKPSFSITSIALGAVSGIATFTNHIPGKWKILTGGIAAAGLAMGAATGFTHNGMQFAFEEQQNAINELRKNPEVRRKLSEYLAAHVTAEDIQRNGIEASVAAHAMSFNVANNLLSLEAKGDKSEFAVGVSEGMFSLESASENRYLKKNSDSKTTYFTR